MISRDRDRVLVAGTVAGLLAKYRVELGGAAELLLGRHQETEREQFSGMVNYEDLVRWGMVDSEILSLHDIARYLEERRIEADGKLSCSDKRDNFILYETEHQKERYKRNR